MKVLVSYLGRNQIFSLEEDQIRDLKQKISSYFEIASTTNFILQRFDKEWDSYIDLGEQDTLEDRDRLRVTIISECTQAAGKTDVMVIHYDYMYTMNSLYFNRSCPVQINEEDDRDLQQIDDIPSTAESSDVGQEHLEGQGDKRY